MSEYSEEYVDECDWCGNMGRDGALPLCVRCGAHTCDLCMHPGTAEDGNCLCEECW